MRFTLLSGNSRAPIASGILPLLLAFLFVSFAGKSQEAPLALLATVSDQQVQLRWQMPRSCNSDFFVIESSLNGNDYTVLAMVQALKNPAASEQYSYLHDLVPKGTHYYRLKEVNKEGQSSYSTPVKVVIGSRKIITVFPNPSKGELNISHPLARGEERLHVMDMNGNLLLQKNISASTVLTKMDLQGIAKGTYQVMWSDGPEKLIQRFVLH